MNAIDIWEESNESTRIEICRRLGWPEQYAEGPADSEWFTSEQLSVLKNAEIDAYWDNEAGEFRLS